MVNCNGKGNGTEGKDEAYRFGDDTVEEEVREVRGWGEEQGIRKTGDGEGEEREERKVKRAGKEKRK